MLYTIIAIVFSNILSHFLLYTSFLNYAFPRIGELLENSAHRL